jgi:hypothetical protein
VQGAARFAGGTETDEKTRRRSGQIRFDRMVCLVEAEEGGKDKVRMMKWKIHR